MHFGHRRPGKFAENVPPNRVPTMTSRPLGRKRLGTASWLQKRPDPFDVATNPLSRGPPQVAQWDSAIAATARGH